MLNIFSLILPVISICIFQEFAGEHLGENPVNLLGESSPDYPLPQEEPGERGSENAEMHSHLGPPGQQKGQKSKKWKEALRKTRSVLDVHAQESVFICSHVCFSF